MKLKKLLSSVLTSVTIGSALVASGQNAVIEQSRGNNVNNPDFVLSGFASGTTSDHTSAPGIVSGYASTSRYSASSIPGDPGTNFVLSPNGGNGTVSNTETSAGTSALQIGTTYLVSVSFAGSPTAASSDIVVSCSDTGMSGIDTFNGTTSTAFQAGSGYNKWNAVGYITPDTANPTIKFSYSSGVSGRWDVDAILFSPLQPPPSGTYQYWNTGSPGGTGTWNTSALNWNTTSMGSGTQGAYVQADLADFAGTAGTVTIQAGGITTDGGLEFDTTGYVINGGTLTLGSSPSTSGTNIAVGPGSTATINSVISGSYGLCSAYLGTLILGGVNTVAGTVTLSSGKVVLGASQNFSSLAGSGGLNLAANTLTVGSDNTSTVYAGTISDGGSSSPGALIKMGAGTLTLSGNNTFAGTTTVEGGAIYFTADANLGGAPSSVVANQLTLNGGALSCLNSTISSNRGITLVGTNNLIYASSAGRTIALNSPISGTGGVTIPGAWPSFNATNTFSGDLVFTVTDNTSARFNTNNCAGQGTIHIAPQPTTTNAPFTLRTTVAGSVTLPNPIYFDESAAFEACYIAVETGGSLTLSGNISGTATNGVDINDSSAGTSGGALTLSGQNSAFKGGFNFEAGVLTVGSPTALGSGAFVVQAGGSSSTVAMQAGVPLTGASALTNIVYLNLSSGFTIQGANSLEFAGPVHLGATGGVTLQDNNSANTIFSGPIDDQGGNLSLSLNGSGSSVIVFNGSNSYTGGTFINSGLLLDGAAANSIPGTVTVNGGELEMDSANAMAQTGAINVNSGTVNLNFTGYQTNAALSIYGSSQPYGIYGASTNNPNGVFTGTGILVVSPTFAITSQSVNTNGNLVVCWQSTPGYNYDVLTNFNLAMPANWTAANSSPITATGTTTCYTVTNGVPSTNVFVSIRADNVTP